MTIELYFKKVISRLLVCTSASSGSSTELITSEEGGVVPSGVAGVVGAGLTGVVTKPISG